MIYSPEIKYVRAYDNYTIDFYLKGEFKSSSPMGNYALDNLDYFIGSFFIGKNEELVPLLTKTLDWLGYAIDKKEDFGVNHDAHLSDLFQAAALAKWLQQDIHDPQLWDQARIHEALAWSSGPEPWGKRDIVTGKQIDEYLAFSCQAGKDAALAGVQQHEKWVGNPKKVSLSGTLSPRRFGYALCLHLSGQQPLSTEKLFEAGRGMLRANLQETWLGAGQSIRAATWLKIVYSLTESKKTPKEILLAAYDDMPDVKRPDFV